MKTLIFILLGLMIAGCSSQPNTIVSQNFDKGVVGAKPQGYPKSLVKALPDQPGFCVEVTESWKQHDHNGEAVWLKQKTVESVSCTKYQWKRLSMDAY